MRKNLILTSVLFTVITASNFAHACFENEKHKLCMDDRVLVSRKEVGTIVEVFDDGSINFKLDDSDEIKFSNNNDISKSVTEYKHFKNKNRILDVSDQVGDRGQILEMFANGRFIVRLDKYKNKKILLEASELEQGVSEFKQFQVGKRVIDLTDNLGDRGEIVELFENGKAFVMLDKNPKKATIYRSSVLAQEVKEYKNFKVGRRVLDLTDNAADRGKILELFDNGRVAVSLDKYPENTRIYKYESLAQNILSEDGFDGFKVNGRVSSKESQGSGVILEVFDEGRIAVKFDDRKKVKRVSYKKLAKSLDCKGTLNSIASK